MIAGSQGYRGIARAAASADGGTLTPPLGTDVDLPRIPHHDGSGVASNVTERPERAEEQLVKAVGHVRCHGRRARANALLTRSGHALAASKHGSRKEGGGVWHPPSTSESGRKRWPLKTDGFSGGREKDQLLPPEEYPIANVLHLQLNA